MIGPIDFTVTSKKYVFEIHLQRNVTVIRGDGATYKSLFCKYIEEAGLVGHGVHLNLVSVQKKFIDLFITKRAH